MVMMMMMMMTKRPLGLDGWTLPYMRAVLFFFLSQQQCPSMGGPMTCVVGALSCQHPLGLRVWSAAMTPFSCFAHGGRSPCFYAKKQQRSSSLKRSLLLLLLDGPSEGELFWLVRGWWRGCFIYCARIRIIIIIIIISEVTGRQGNECHDWGSRFWDRTFWNSPSPSPPLAAWIVDACMGLEMREGGRVAAIQSMFNLRWAGYFTWALASVNYNSDRK